MTPAQIQSSYQGGASSATSARAPAGSSGAATTSWNAHQKACAGKGMTPAQIQSSYQGGAASATSARAPATPAAAKPPAPRPTGASDIPAAARRAAAQGEWNDFQSALKERGFTRKEVSLLYQAHKPAEGPKKGAAEGPKKTAEGPKKSASESPAKPQVPRKYAMEAQTGRDRSHFVPHSWVNETAQRLGYSQKTMDTLAGCFGSHDNVSFTTPEFNRNHVRGCEMEIERWRDRGFQGGVSSRAAKRFGEMKRHFRQVVERFRLADELPGFVGRFTNERTGVFAESREPAVVST